MRIQISTRIKRVYSFRGRYFLDYLYQPIVERRNARCIFRIKIRECDWQGVLVVQPQLAFGPELKAINRGSRIKLPLEKEEHEFIWNFIPYEPGHNQIRLHIEQLGDDDRVYDEYNSYITTGNYFKSFAVYSFIEYILLWFTGISTLGAIAEIINLLI